MPEYDHVAHLYDEHYSRPVDRWEDERLTRLLRPWVDDAEVLDLGCGTGWVLDHLAPFAYIGVDCSEPMLGRLLAKHPNSEVHLRDVDVPGWESGLGTFDVAVSTWAGNYFSDLGRLLDDLATVVKPGGVIALHGQGPRRRTRGHYLAGEAFTGGHDWTPAEFKRATWVAPVEYLGAWGTGALADPLPGPGGRVAWTLASTLTPPAHHYGILGAWRVL